MSAEANERRKTASEGCELEGEEYGEYGDRGVIRKHDPRKPSEDVRREHEMTHIPYRSWCRHCVRGRGTEEPHRRLEGKEVEVPEIHMDSMFMGEEDGGRGWARNVSRVGWSGKDESGYVRECGSQEVHRGVDNQEAWGLVEGDWGRVHGHFYEDG